MPPLFGIVGWKNNGKTTMTVRLVEELTRRGYRIATIKHAHHDFDIDHAGTDSWRHRQAGAAEVAVVSSRRFALIHELGDEPEPPLAHIVEKLGACDLVLIEGYKNEDHDKLEVRRQTGKSGAPLTASDPHIVAIASDMTKTLVPEAKNALEHFQQKWTPALREKMCKNKELERLTEPREVKTALEKKLPHFDIDAIVEIADFIETRFSLSGKGSQKP